MANLVTEQLAEASFDGIVFRVRTEAISKQGRRIILHEYLNSSRIFAEDLGEIPPHFSIDAFIHSDRNVSPDQTVIPNFLQKAEKFRNILKKRRTKPGLLTLPTIGTIKVMSLAFTEERSQESVGEVRFSIEFVKAQGSIVANAAPPSTPIVFTLSDACRVEIQEVAIEKFESTVLTIEQPDLNINSYLSMLDDLTQLPTDIANQSRNFIQAGTFGRIKDSIRNFTNALPNLLDIPGNMFGALVSQFEDVVGIFQDLSNAFSEDESTNSSVLANNLGRTGSGLPVDMSIIKARTADPNESTIDSFAKPIWNETTIQRTQRNDARSLMLDTFRACWLLIAYEQASINEYLTNLDIDKARLDLEELYANIVTTEMQNEKSFLSSQSVLSLINQVKNATYAVLDQKEQQAYRVTTIDCRYVTSAINLSYELYAEEFTTMQQLQDRAEVIASLNPSQRPDRMSGELTVLQVR